MMTAERGRNDEIAQPPGELCLSVVTVTYNSAKVLPGLLDSLVTGLEGIQTFEVVVVDNGSIDNSVEIASAHPIRPRVIRMSRNAGYAAGINAATATVRKDANVLILNPDVRLLPSAAGMLVGRLRDPSVCVAVPRILGEDGKTTWSLRREPSILTAWTDALLGGTLAARIGSGERIGNPARYDRDGLAQWAEGSVLAIAAHTRDLVGDWDESFFLYSEEVDYMRRVRAAGRSIAYVSQAHAVHIGGDYQNPRLAALLALNRIRYYRRYHGPLSTAIFRLGIVMGEALRAGRGSAHRAALRAALTLPTSKVSDLIEEWQRQPRLPSVLR